MSYLPIHSVDLENNKYENIHGNVSLSQLQNNAIIIDNNDMDFVVLKKNVYGVSNNYKNVHNLDSLYSETRESNKPSNTTGGDNDTIIKLYIGSITVVGLFIFFRILKKSV